MRFSNHKVRSQRGATMVEFALIAALVLTLVFGILEYGLIFLQEHYVANAAREGARIGVLANNYDCFAGEEAIGFDACTSDRVVKTEAAVNDYLDLFYDPEDIEVQITRTGDETAGKVLQVIVEVQSIAPPLISGLLQLLRDGSDVENPRSIGFTATMEYEDPEEWDAEENAK